MIDFDGMVLGPCMDVFGEAVLVAHVGGPSYQISGVFDEAYMPLMPNADLAPGNITTVKPVLGIRQSDLQADIEQNDVVTILRTSEVFWVNEAQPDGHGHILLTLNEAP